MTSEEIHARAKDEGLTGYGGWSRDRGLGPGEGRVLRFRVPDGATVINDLVRGVVEFDNATIEDFVLVRGNGTPVFILANVVDDLEMGITHVVRAEEHLPNTPKQQMIWSALGHDPPVWAHVPVLVNEQRKKLSKRRDKVALEQYRDEGYLADAMINYLMTLGWSPGDDEIVPWSQIEPAFRLEDVNKSPAYFDLKKLAAFNGEYIRQLSLDDLVAACDPWLPESWDRERFRAIAPHIQERMVTLADAATAVDFMFTDDPAIDEAAWEKATATEFAAPLLRDLVSAYETCDWDAATLKAAMDDLATRYEVKRNAQAAARVAVTGRSAGPPLFEVLEVLGRAESLRRLRAGLARLS
jgi:glutamyl-tRNA synthetase